MFDKITSRICKLCYGLKEDYVDPVSKDDYGVVSLTWGDSFCCSLPENILSLTPTSNSLTQKYLHFIESTLTKAFVAFMN